MTKVCTKCKTSKSLDEFHNRASNADGKHTRCKLCRNEEARRQWRASSDRINTKRRHNYKLNPDRKREESRRYNVKHKDRVRSRNVRYYWKNRSKSLNSSRERLKSRYKSDIVYRHKLISSAVLRSCFSNRPYTARSKMYPIVGLDGNSLKNYLWSTFELRYGLPRDFIPRRLVEIDHIIPLCTARTIEDVDKLSHYTNLQLLFKEDNQAKYVSTDIKGESNE